MPRPIRRRSFIAGALGVAGVAGASALVASATEGPARSAQRVPVPSAAPGAQDAVATVEWVRSVARGRWVRLVLVAPPGVDRGTVPVCLGLHGLGGNAEWWADAGTRRTLGAARAGGAAPFLVAAVDGGDNYWRPVRSGDDPRRMLLDELPGWLGLRGVGRTAPDGVGVPSLVAGVSMGGAGALMYARDRARRATPVRAAAAMSPGLFTEWRVASRRPFANEADWAANDPLRFHPELASTPTGGVGG